MAVTKTLRHFAGALLCFFPLAGWAAVLPEERADIMYHSYSGGGVTIDGPSLLVRKNVGNSLSLSANYYVDMISGASIDVQATASRYTEQRDEYSLGADYLVDKTTLSVGYTNSSENDYEANTFSFGVSQAFFGDLSTLDLRVSYGSDDVYRNGDDNFAAEAEHRRYALSWNQILTQKLIAELSVETVSDEGFLNNPYRSVRYLDPTSGSGFSYQPELYPSTRNSDAAAIRFKYYLPYRAAIKGEYRRYADSWGIVADNIEFRYTHPLEEKDQWILEGKARVYKQTGADFYSDLFPYLNATNFRARDKELSDYSNASIGIGVSYVLPDRWSLFNRKNTLSLYWDYIYFDYENFRDVTVHGSGTAIAPGEEPTYSFGANVIRFFWSVWL
ncbi:DUF3570 domain-containing protein [Microbulbifer thermotolerans]|uniref:DUF3570 domain-containing protein n=1 Tax=Microbulbifer thermotolerans TaxID=252514 RepID=A0AB35HZV9_MICTH|nr:DUF3570 domain-containing protein [Microbulbifer thermotolerans]MCX2783618.1 DUF3570 domain-containing protein [Microbulbifer thermotolerans]MCX2795829.1 DUF3570 domain-containing protein [Microbulbifer thermotolerans]MCX2801993.1 DUF3570 domain-containing protein [Microbulbifer thermotolerans]MCX2833738.1 DUF3570 domain-containing protein [Microbulbifer thermotolerans]MCX2842075.1 DUF3570 domain-containing protein [Microbulbifer thermotolerans]